MARFDLCPGLRSHGLKRLPGSLWPHKKLAPSEGSGRLRRGHMGHIMNETFVSAAPPAVSVIVPVRNEAGNLSLLIAEIASALGDDLSFEVIYVNDGSSDRTEAE